MWPDLDFAIFSDKMVELGFDCRCVKFQRRILKYAHKKISQFNQIFNNYGYKCQTIVYKQKTLNPFSLPKPMIFPPTNGRL